MLLTAIIIASVALAFGLLKLLDRYENATDKLHAERSIKKAPKLVYYDAFTKNRPSVQRGHLPANEVIS